MAENHEELGPDTGPDLAPAYVRELLGKRGIESLACPACGADSWGAYTDVAVYAIKGRNPATGEIAGGAGAIHAISMTCGGCGYMCLFDREIAGD